jgi:hypothetical protein
MTARTWLLQNGYSDVVVLIEKVEAGWRERGVTTRRNWWEILSGGHDGHSRTVSDISFPVLATAQIHENRPVTSNAIRRNRSETAPDKDFRGRSTKGRRRSAKRRST